MLTILPRIADVKDIKCVINYDMPHSAEDYVHRYSTHLPPADHEYSLDLEIEVTRYQGMMRNCMRLVWARFYLLCLACLPNIRSRCPPSRSAFLKA